MKLRLALVTIVLFAASTMCNAIIITFDPAPIPGGLKAFFYTYTEQDFQFTQHPNALIGFIVNDTSNSQVPYDGTAFLQSAGLPTVITTLDTRPFTLSSVDLAEYSTFYPAPITIPFTGTKEDGSTVSTSFTLDGIIDGNGPLQDFQTFSFPASFTDLTSVTINSNRFSMDNLQVAVTPEPSTTLFGLGLLAVGCVRLSGFSRRQQRKLEAAFAAVSEANCRARRVAPQNKLQEA